MTRQPPEAAALSWRGEAFNQEPDSANEIHGDALARLRSLDGPAGVLARSAELRRLWRAVSWVVHKGGSLGTKKKSTRANGKAADSS